MAAVLEFKNVNYTYPDRKEAALKNINFTVEKGEFVGIIGPNNAGKSTICRTTNGLIPNSFGGELKGSIFVNGENINDKKTALLAQRVGMVFSDPEAQLSQMSVWEEISFGAANLCVPKQEIFSRLENVLKLLKIEKLRDRSPFELSGGEQQRVAIASVLAMQPEILVLDEPTSNLDPQGTEEVFAAVKDLNKKSNITVVIVEHEIELLAEYADRIIFMNNGEIVLNGPPSEVFHSIDIFDQAGMNIPQVTETAYILDKTYKKWGNAPYPMTVDEAYEKFSAIK
ncbi:MAG: ABC transporter ATP-binding protein [Bacillota bacterium]|nr:ABC transporter ATP-binding protein [Bacillota bacterium]